MCAEQRCSRSVQCGTLLLHSSLRYFLDLFSPWLVVQDGKEVMDKIMGYKLAPLSEAFAKLDKM